jgi:putative ABC transport system permease protein
MSPLWSKFYRDLKANLAQFIAVIIVICLGTGFFIASFSSYLSVQESLNKTYQELNFPSYWLELDGETPAVLPEGAELRETAQVSVELQQGEVAGARLIGIPSGGPQFNKLKIKTGAYPGEGQVLVEASFAKFHGLQLGDTIGFRVGEKVYNWVVAGTAGSPEYLWSVADRFTPNPSPRTFGVFYIPQKQLLRDVTGLRHEILTGKQDLRELMTGLQAQNVKVKEIYGRSEQPSQQIFALLFNGFKKVAAVLPWLFLLATGLATFALISVLVKAQGQQIRVLRCLGFSRWQILTHYLGFGLLAGIVGSVLGCILGTALSGKLTGVLAGIIGLPFVVNGVETEVLLTAIICTCLAAVLGGVAPALESSKGIERKTVGRVAGWHRYIPVVLRLPLNNLRRDINTTVFGILVTALGVCLISVGFLLYESIWDSGTKQFEQYQTYDLRVQFRSALKEDVTKEVSEIPGIKAVNPFFEVPVIVQLNKKQVPSLLVGTTGDMLKIEDRLGNPIDLKGLYLSNAIKDELKAGWTPKVNLMSPTGNKQEFAVKGYVRWHIGNQIFAPLEYVQAISGKKGITGVYIQVDEQELDNVRAKLYKYPTIFQVDSPKENLADQRSLLEFTYVYLRILIVFGLVLAGAIIFSTARVLIIARTSEYTTMRILGLGLGKIGFSIAGEYLFILLMGLILGYVTGVGLAYYLLRQVNSLLLYNQLNIKPETLGLIAMFSCLIVPAAIVSAMLTVKKISLSENTREQN